MIEPITSGIESKWRLTKGKATGIICLLGFLASLIFITGGGLYWLEIVDQFISNFGLVLVGLAECLIIGWVFHLPRLREHANKTSDIKIGRWWDILIKYVIPIVLTTLLLIALYDLLTSPQKYPLSALLVGGVAPCVIVFLLAFFFVRMQGKKGGHQ
jgi:NSS family neurotransmitter:Na+ symporter